MCLFRHLWLIYCCFCSKQSSYGLSNLSALHVMYGLGSGSGELTHYLMLNKQTDVETVSCMVMIRPNGIQFQALGDCQQTQYSTTLYINIYPCLFVSLPDYHSLTQPSLPPTTVTVTLILTVMNDAIVDQFLHHGDSLSPRLHFAFLQEPVHHLMAHETLLVGAQVVASVFNQRRTFCVEKLSKFLANGENSSFVGCTNSVCHLSGSGWITGTGVAS